MFEGNSADMCAEKFPLMLMGGRAEGLECAVPGARTPIGMSGNFIIIIGIEGLECVGPGTRTPIGMSGNFIIIIGI